MASSEGDYPVDPRKVFAGKRETEERETRGQGTLRVCNNSPGPL